MHFMKFIAKHCYLYISQDIISVFIFLNVKNSIFSNCAITQTKLTNVKRNQWRVIIKKIHVKINKQIRHNAVEMLSVFLRAEERKRLIMRPPINEAVSFYFASRPLSQVLHLTWPCLRRCTTDSCVAELFQCRKFEISSLSDTKLALFNVYA